ncbi:TIGR03792 family protein [Egbenema bharatensis]|uniref:TIGR03792 family protein n=1 Tax=Egbenema bharatensis TaxID=3463334 RepID=UPI003A835F81
MTIEWLKFRVSPDSRERFVQVDAELWTPFLSQYPGFISKEVWISPDDLSEVVQVIYWETFEQWQAIPAEALDRVETQFAEAMGDVYELLESKRYQVRKRN